jgi:hypothetical protein
MSQSKKLNTSQMLKCESFIRIEMIVNAGMDMAVQNETDIPG